MPVGLAIVGRGVGVAAGEVLGDSEGVGLAVASAVGVGVGVDLGVDGAGLFAAEPEPELTGTGVGAGLVVKALTSLQAPLFSPLIPLTFQ